MLLTADRPQGRNARPPLAPEASLPDRWHGPSQRERYDSWQAPHGEPEPEPGLVPDAATIASLLDEDEVIEWAGRPAPGGLVRWSLACWTVFLPWTLFCLHWINGLGLGDPGGLDDPFRWFCATGYPFLALGLGGLATPLWVGHRARRTLHVITDRRELSFENGVLARSVRHRSPIDERLPQVRCDPKADRKEDRGFGVPSSGEDRFDDRVDGAAQRLDIADAGAGAVAWH